MIGFGMAGLAAGWGCAVWTGVELAAGVDPWAFAWALVSILFMVGGALWLGAGVECGED